MNLGKSGPAEQPSGSIMARMARISVNSILDSIRYILPMAIFFIKFLEWWYSPSSPARALSAAPNGPLVPPPRLLTPHPEGVGVDSREYGTCPICKGPISNATALPTGYVFCYRCIYAFIEKQGKCPVTLVPSHIWQLRKVLI